MKRVGLLGGTFDPPHIGHLWLAETAAAQLRLDQVIFMPVGQPPHKQTQRVSAVHHRIAMAQLAIATQKTFAISTLDTERTPPHTTATLLPLLQAQLGNAQIWLLTGSDSLRDLASWSQPQTVITQCRLAVLPRSGVKVDWLALETAVPGVSAEVDMLAGPQISLSSTELRQWSAEGNPLSPLVPERVCTYINDHTLYL